MPVSLSCSREGSCGGSPWAMWYMMAHSLSMDAQGRRPVAISRITQPRDHTSTAPWRPVDPPRMTSGDMYGHGALTALTGVGSEGAALAGDKFGGAEVDVFDYTVVVEKDV
jgi:hypothetical protein